MRIRGSERRTLLICTLALAACSTPAMESGVAATAPSMAGARATVKDEGSLHISSVGAVDTQQYQTFAIVGGGFGTLSPYFGDSAYLEIYDLNGNWRAGCGGRWGRCGVTVDVTSWTDRQIVIGGFGGTFGKWVLHRGDPLVIVVWNAQTGAGPAVAVTKVR